MHLPSAATLLGLASLLLRAPSRAQDQVELEVAWGPIASTTYRLPERFPVVRAIFEAGAAAPRASVPVESLRVLLPEAGVLADADPGAMWTLGVDRVLPLLAKLHPGVTRRLRHAHAPPAETARRQGGDGPPGWSAPAVEGGRATLLRSSQEELAVLLRVHVEWELIPGELYFLPAQFEGLLVWDRRSDRPRSLHLALPSRDTNFDLNYADRVDIGHLPLMQVATAGAVPAGSEAEPARQRLRESFYPSARIRWRSLAEALARARENGRRLHVLQLFGTFDDESC